MQTFIMFLLIIASVVLMVFAGGFISPAPPALRPPLTWWVPSRAASAAS